MKFRSLCLLTHFCQEGSLDLFLQKYAFPIVSNNHQISYTEVEIPPKDDGFVS